MSEDNETPALSRLLAKAGRRTAPPSETREAVYVSALVAWQQALAQRRQQRHRLLALAASLVAAIGVVWYAVSARAPALVAATGTVDGREIHVGEALSAGDKPGLVLRTAMGEQVRIDKGSVAQFVAQGRIRLSSGRIYVQSSDSRAEGLVVETRLGSVTHVGTRYAIDLGNSQLRVNVRDGLVNIAFGETHSQVGGGMRMVLDQSGRQPELQRIASYGPLWAWSDRLTPALEIDGRRLSDVLLEIAFETGRRLEFADDVIRQACARIELRGPFLDMPATDRLFAVLITTGLEAVESGDRILIQQHLEDTAGKLESD
jgi:ferric-dicitrate binding protein FerR (iron transport regulator)